MVAVVAAVVAVVEEEEMVVMLCSCIYNMIKCINMTGRLSIYVDSRDVSSYNHYSFLVYINILVGIIILSILSIIIFLVLLFLVYIKLL